MTKGPIKLKKQLAMGKNPMVAKSSKPTEFCGGGAVKMKKGGKVPAKKK